ncbi:MAG: formylglycine-generating enzyme family protein [Bacteroidaceae bacterium]|nr:formylglycine-generating enzyme family protein [Bacteroidaceae bacterium]
MKKYLFYVAAALFFTVLPLSLASCGGSDDDDAPKNDAPNIVYKTFDVDGVTFKMIAVQGGTFRMGSEDGSENEMPVHTVILSDYYIGETEVTQALYTAVMGTNPSHFRSDKLPVEQVSYNDCKSFISELNTLTGQTFRLPTEAEWEYAARGGQKSRGYKYSGSNDIDEVAWYADNSDDQTHDVATKKPNELGLYDMSGNVWELCSDWFGSEYYASSPTENPGGPSYGLFVVARGGCWFESTKYSRVAFRNWSTDENRSKYLGFRLVLSSIEE